MCLTNPDRHRVSRRRGGFTFLTDDDDYAVGVLISFIFFLYHYILAKFNLQGNENVTKVLKKGGTR